MSHFRRALSMATGLLYANLGGVARDCGPQQLLERGDVLAMF